MDIAGFISIRRSISIPKQIGQDNILALIDLGGKIFNKDTVYSMFFELGFPAVKAHLLAEFKRRGGSEEQFEYAYDEFKEKYEITKKYKGERKLVEKRKGVQTVNKKGLFAQIRER